MKNLTKSELSFRKQMFVASFLFALFFVALLSVGGYIISKDLGEKEVFKTLEHYRNELQKMTTSISETEIAKGFKYQKVVTTRLNQFVVDKKIFDSYELYDSDGNLIDQKDFLKGGGFITGTGIVTPPLGKSTVEIKNKVPIEVPVQLEPGKMGKAVLNISNQVLTKQAEEFRREMIIKLSTLLGLIFFMLLLAYFYVIHLLRQYRTIQKEIENQNKFSYLGFLSSGLAHEIKNPLNSLKLNVQLLEEGLKSDVDRADLLPSISPMLNQIKKLEKLTHDFLIFAKPLNPEFKKIDLVEIAKETAFLLLDSNKEKEIQIEFDEDDFAKNIFADESLMRIVFSNLIFNSIQSSEKKGKIEVKFSKFKSSCQIDIIDYGEGIKDENRDKIFDIFFTTKAEGTGLGLAIVKRIIEAHNGKIEVVDEKVGAHFRIMLPLE
jgi:signal transduction histidine kinase